MSDWCGCSLRCVRKHEFVCDEHGYVHHCGSTCKESELDVRSNQLVCRLTAVVVGTAKVGEKRTATEMRQLYDKRGRKKRKTVDGGWIALVPKTTSVLADIGAQGYRSGPSKSSQSRNRRPPRTTVTLAKVTGLLRSMLMGPKRLEIERQARNKRIRTMVETGKKAMAKAQRAGKTLSLVKIMAWMEAAVDPTGYRMVGVDGVLADDMIMILGMYIQSAFEIIAKVRHELKIFFELPEDQRGHGIPPGQHSKCSAKMDLKTFVSQIVMVMASGGMRSIHGDKRELIPACLFCRAAFPSSAEMGKVVGKTTKFKLESIIHQADRIPDDIVGDPALGFERCMGGYESLMVYDEAPRPVLSSSMLRFVDDMGPFYVCQPPENMSEAVVLSKQQAEVLDVALGEGPFDVWEDADRRAKTMIVEMRTRNKLGVAGLWS